MRAVCEVCSWVCGGSVVGTLRIEFDPASETFLYG